MCSSFVHSRPFQKEELTSLFLSIMAFPQHKVGKTGGGGLGAQGHGGGGGSFPLSLSFLHHSVIESVFSDSFLPSLC